MMTSKLDPIAVYGATGHTGRFVLEELLRRELRPIAVARDEGRLAALSARWPGVPIRAARADDPAALDRAFAGSTAVINCAGPFLDTATPVAASAVRVGVHYLDVAAEQAAAAETFRLLDAPAREAGVAVIPGVGFYGGLADLLVTAAARGLSVVDSVTIAIALSSWHPTLGTRRTGERNTVPRVTLRNGALILVRETSAPSSWKFPVPFGERAVTPVALTEVPLLARHLRIGNLTTLLTSTALSEIANPETPPPTAIDPRGRSAQQFVVDVQLDGEGQTRRAIASGLDIYAFTAPLVVEILTQIASSTPVRPGAHAPGELVDSAATLAALARCVPDFRVAVRGSSC
jgi:uncharacterized protein YbjT (DUF2867 family)